ncbi:hypothetical protein E4T56_gene20877 [Termitomyces sp. T112]|nr:hypothetical protein E4T56_gene20877 [Termitomyces sp. T112]
MLALTPAISVACPLLLEIPIDVNAARKLHAALLLCWRCQKPGHFAWHCLLGLEDDWSSGGALEEEHRGEFGGVHKLELLNKAVEASQITSQWLAQAFAANAMPQEFWDVVLPYLHAFENVFFKALFDSLLECKSCKVYLLVPREQNKLDAFLQENLDSGGICPSKSLMASPVFFIKKKDHLLRLGEDYQVLNAMRVKNCYPLPLISKLINNPQGVQYFTKLDIWWGYNNVCIQEGDEWKATFQTNQGLFKPLVMFFVLTNSPATFQTMMNNIFQDLIAESVACVYLDNILIYTKILEEHHQITHLILECLHQHQLYLKPEKSTEMDLVKVAGVVEWLEPKTKKEVQVFLGFMNFYWRFIQDFSHHACPLFDLTEKDVT